MGVPGPGWWIEPPHLVGWDGLLREAAIVESVIHKLRIHRGPSRTERRLLAPSPDIVGADLGEIADALLRPGDG